MAASASTDRVNPREPGCLSFVVIVVFFLAGASRPRRLCLVAVAVRTGAFTGVALVNGALAASKALRLS